jgi:hypothetical protein
MDRDVHTSQELTPREFIGASEIGDKTPTLTIAAAKYRVDKNKRGEVVDEFGWLEFKEQRRLGGPIRMRVNATNRRCIEAMLGTDAREWKGKRITLFATNKLLQFPGKREPCLRIYGSPELARDMPIELPSRGGSVRHTLKATGKKPAPPPPETRADSREGGDAADGALDLGQ